MDRGREDHHGGRSGGSLPIRSLPHNLEAERSVLMNVVLEPSTIPDVLRVLSDPGDFYDANHGKIFASVLAIFNRGGAIDCVSVVEQMRREGHRELSRVGGPFDEIMLGQHFSWHAVEHAAVVRQKAILRAMMEAAEDIIRSGYDNDRPADDVLAEAMDRLRGISDDHLASGTTTVAEMLPAVLERMERRRAGEVMGLPSGITDLDSITDGFQPQEMVIVGARASMGKTALAMQICDHVSVSWGKPSLFVSLEMNEFALSERTIVSRARISGQKVRTGQELEPDEFDRLAIADAQIRAGAPIHVVLRPSRNIVQIVNEIRAVKARHDIKLVVFDYIQLIDSDNPRESEVQALTKISGAIKALARDLNIPVLVLSQLNRSLESREDKCPRMSDLRGSGSLEQDADLILLLHRPEYFDPNDRPGLAQLIVAKNRSGRTGSIELTFLKEMARFENCARVTTRPEDSPF